MARECVTGMPTTASTALLTCTARPGTIAPPSRLIGHSVIAPHLALRGSAQAQVLICAYLRAGVAPGFWTQCHRSGAAAQAIGDVREKAFCAHPVTASSVGSLGAVGSGAGELVGGGRR